MKSARESTRNWPVLFGVILSIASNQAYIQNLDISFTLCLRYMIRLIFSVHVAAETYYRHLTSLLHRSARCLFEASVPSWAQSGWSTVGLAQTLTVAGRGAISERWVAAAHLPVSA